MARTYLSWSISLALAVVICPTVRADDPTPGSGSAKSAARQQHPPGQPAHLIGLTCTVYSLSNFGDDAHLGKWIADTIPQVVQPETWNMNCGHGVLSYYAPAKILVIHQTPMVHSQVEAFLKNVKQALPPARESTVAKTGRNAGPDPMLVPAHYLVPHVTKTADVTGLPKSGYPVPNPVQQPKHLFHLILRYEGEGIVDAEMVQMLKGLVGDSGASAAEGDKSAPAKPDLAKPTSLNQLFNFIIRYEGDGIIDANVAELFKAYIKENAPKEDKSSGATFPMAIYAPSGPVYAPSGSGVAPKGSVNSEPGTTLPGTLPGVNNSFPTISSNTNQPIQPQPGGPTIRSVSTPPVASEPAPKMPPAH